MWGSKRVPEKKSLPELPEGYYWRTTEGKYNYNFVHLMKKSRWGDKSIGSSLVKKTAFTKENIIEAAEWVMREFDYLIEEKSINPHLLGDFPPKVL